MNLLIVHEHQLLADALKVILEPNPNILSVNLLPLRNASTQNIKSFAPDVLFVDCFQSQEQIAQILIELSRSIPAIFLLSVNQSKDILMLSEIANIKNIFKLENGLKDLLSELGTLANTQRQKRFDDTFYCQSSFFSQHKISLREAQVIALMMQGDSSEAISEKLFISVHTVNTHKRNIYQKFSVPNERELIKLVQSGYKIEHTIDTKN